jgi:hypothetical protein
MTEKKAYQNSLNVRVLKLAQVALLNDPIHVLAVVFKIRREIFVDGYGVVEGGLRCHEYSILRIQRIC